MQSHRVLNPSIDEDAARSLLKFITDMNDGITHARVVGYLHGGNGAKIRLEPVEKFNTKTVNKWNKLGKRCGLHVSNVEADLTAGHADLHVEYKPSRHFNMIEWKNLIWPLLVLIALTKYALPIFIT